MSGSSIVIYLNPWKRKRQLEQQLRALRERDGDNCRRCRRPMRFDLTSGHDQAPSVQQIGPDRQGIENLCLCHVRCNADGGDATPEVQERLRRKQEATLLSRKGRGRKRASA